MKYFLSVVLTIALSITGYCKDDTLVPYLKKHGMAGKELLFIVSVNPAECGKYKMELTSFCEKIEKEKVSQNVLYIVKGLRQKEVPYFISKELNFVSPKSKVIADDDLYFRVNKFPGSGVTILSYDKIKGSFPIMQALSRIQLSSLPEAGYHATLTDSVVINEDKNIISNLSRFKIVDDTRMLLLDNTYNFLSSYDLKTGKVLATYAPEYDYAGLYRTYINSDTAKAGFARRGVSVIERYNMKAFSMDNLYVNGNNVYVTCQFLYAEYGGGKDTFLIFYPFLIKTTLDLKKAAIVGIPDTEQSFATLGQNAFWSTNDTDFVFTVSGDHIDTTGRYLAAFRYSEKDKKLAFTKMLQPSLPEYFVKNHIGYSFGPTGCFTYKKNMYSYFNWLVPYAYNTSAKSMIAFSDTSVKSADRYTWNELKLPFELITVSPVSDDDIAFVSSTKKGFELKIMKASTSEVVYTYNLPEHYHSGKMEIKGDQLYILKSQNDRTYLYRFKIR